MLGTAATPFALTPLGPFRWQASLDVMANFGPIARHWRDDPDTIRLAFPLDGTFEPVAVALRWDGSQLVGEVAGTTDVNAVARQVARIFSLDSDGSRYEEVGRRDPEVGKLMIALPGLRPVCFTSPYECAAWGIISQRISMRQAAAIQSRLVAENGTRLEVAGGEARAFPSPERLAAVDSVAGLPAVKVERLHAVAAAALAGTLDAERLRALGPLDGPTSVRTISGIGPFWASGVYLRGAGITDEFPDEPLAIAALGALHGVGERPDQATLTRLTDAFRPYRMWVCFLLRVAAGRGVIPGIAGREMAIRRGFGEPGTPR